MWHVSSRSSVATLRTAIHLLLLLKSGPVWCNQERDCLGHFVRLANALQKDGADDQIRLGTCEFERHAERCVIGHALELTRLY